MSYAPYPAYKDSGVPWLGQVPEGWEVRRVRNMADVLSSNVDKKTFEGEIPVRLCNYVDVYYNDIITDQINFMAATATPSEIERFSLRAGDVVITKDSESADDIGVPALITDQAGDIVCGYHLAIFRGDAQHVHGPYLFYAIKSEPSARQFEVSANGVTRFGLPYGALKSLALPLPPIEEQTAISDFLDEKTAEIDDLIAKKEELLRLLAEQRTALITHAVTKGLNPTAPMKPSGIVWLGDVPEGWDIRPISTAIQKLESGVSVNAMDVPAEDDQQGVLKTSAVYSGSFDPTQNKFIYDPVEAERLACPVRKGELIISRMNTPDLVGAVGIVEDEYPNLFLPDRLWQTRFWTQATANAQFLYYFFNSKLFRAVIASLASGTSGSMQNITQSDLMKIKIGMPPLSEQSQIVDHLDQALEKLDATREKTGEAIKKLREYRTALITNAVTGKIKVA